jgi:hypothetical protein
MYSNDPFTGGEIAIGRITAPSAGQPVVTMVWGTPLNASQRWNPGWTSFAALHLREPDGRPYPCVLAYKAASGEITLEKINPDGMGTTTLWRTPPVPALGWEKDYAWLTAFEVCELGQEPLTHVLAYNPGTGEVRIDRVEPDGSAVTNVWRRRPGEPRAWSEKWTGFVTLGLVLPFRHGPVPYYFCYNPVTGEWYTDRF